MQPRDDDIYASAPLRRLLDAQTCVLKQGLQRCFGAHALLLGASSDDVPPALPMLGCWTSLHLSGSHYRGDLRAAADEPLPFVDDAFELVLLRHALEVAPLPASLLDEAIRVLAPGGVLALTGVHPLGGWSPWFCWHARGRPRALQMPWRLRHQLESAGLAVEQMQRVGSALPGLKTAPQALAGTFGGGYVLVARKRRRLATPLRLNPSPVRVPANSRLSPGTRRSAAL
ncbi:MAG: methyltransferase domain-containing protein [Rhodanobacter sp.]|jgi:SAM-dependent methyltransferase|uniref:class I SAM-dependent methyltransferase n=1 Tax=Rhodanobacter sp. KK11 TaxID=3083255 RepID=UPI0029664FCC|nr:methyltransferase domain-containing protein [Rhodanobacter sp. KK11]MDW2981506.1 methyltransferase domain-containing protein [Rhodanobacter sp. KK11]